MLLSQSIRGSARGIGQLCITSSASSFSTRSTHFSGSLHSQPVFNHVNAGPLRSFSQKRQKEDSEDIPRPTEGSEEDESSEHVVLDVQARAAPAGGAPRGRMAPSKKATWASTLPKEWVTELEKYDSEDITGDIENDEDYEAAMHDPLWDTLHHEQQDSRKEVIPKHTFPGTYKRAFDVDWDYFKYKRLLYTWRTTKVTKSVKEFSVKHLVIIGDGNGLIGYGIGKSKDQELSLKKSWKDARRNLQVVERVQKRTVRFEVEQKFKGSSVHLVPMYAGYGRSGSLLGTELLTMAGIRDASIRFSGRRHPVNRLIAFFMALEKAGLTPEDEAMARGKKYWLETDELAAMNRPKFERAG